MGDEKRRTKRERIDQLDNVGERLARVGEAPLDNEVVVDQVVGSDLDDGAVRGQAEQNHHRSARAELQRTRH